MTLDRYKTTVRFDVIIKNGLPVPKDPNGFPKLQEGSIGELVMPSHAVVDKHERSALLARSAHRLLPAGSNLLVRMDPREKLPDTLKRRLATGPGVPGPCVEVKLLADLALVRHGTKKASLDSCKCFIPALNAEAESVNHAYTLVSSAFEPWRRSHTGNVFDCVYFEASRDRWLPLEQMRMS